MWEVYFFIFHFIIITFGHCQIHTFPNPTYIGNSISSFTCQYRNIKAMVPGTLFWRFLHLNLLYFSQWERYFQKDHHCQAPGTRPSLYTHSETLALMPVFVGFGHCYSFPTTTSTPPPFCKKTTTTPSLPAQNVFSTTRKTRKQSTDGAKTGMPTL